MMKRRRASFAGRARTSMSAGPTGALTDLIMLTIKSTVSVSCLTTMGNGMTSDASEAPILFANIIHLTCELCSGLKWAIDGLVAAACHV